MPSTAEYLAAQPNMLQEMSAGSDYVNKLYARSAQVKAGQQYAGGDTSGAQTTLASSGDIAGAQQVHNDTVQNFQTQHAYIARAVPVFQQIYTQASQGGQNKQAGAQALVGAFDHLAPELQQIGIPAQNLMQIRQGLASDPDNTLQALGSLASKQPEFQKTGDTTGIIWDKGTGQVLAHVNGDKIINAPPQDQVIRYGGDGGAAPSGAPQAAPAPMMSTPAGAGAPTQQAGVFPSQIDPSAVAQVESRGNPNAVSPAGATGTMQTMSGTLQSPGYGVKPAANNSPQEQTRVGQDYVQAMSQKYGPAIGLVAYNMGPGATDKWLASGGDFAKLPDETQKYIGRVAIEEAMSRRGGSQPAPAAPAPQSQSAPGVQVLQAPQMEYRDATADEQAKGIRQVNRFSGEEKMEPMSMLPGNPKTISSMVDAIGQYKQAPLSGYSLRSMQGQQVMAGVYDKYPDYDAKNFGKFQQGYKAFATGPQSNTVRSLNVWVQHSEVLKQAAQALQNGDTPIFNKLRNWWQGQTGSELPSNFDAVRNLYAEEATKAILGGAGALGDRDTVRATINSAQSPAQLAGVANRYNQLAAGQLNGLKRQYENATGRKDFNSLLDPQTVATLEKHSKGMTPASGTPKIRTYNPATGKLE